MTSFVRRQLWPAIALLALMTLITGAAYPAVVTAVAQVVFPSQANGSMITVNGQTVGSSLIGQVFDQPTVLLGPPVGGAAQGLRRHGLRRHQPRADQPEADRQRHRCGRRDASCQRRRAGPRRPCHDIGVRPRSGHQPRRGRVPGRARGHGAEHDAGRRAGDRRATHGAADARLPGRAARQRPGAQPRPRRSA